MRIEQLKFTSVIFAVLMSGTITIQAQQTKVASTTTIAAPDTSLAAATPADSSERERMLLERIDKLEKRLADLESRTPAKPDALSQPDANVAMAKPAADSTGLASPTSATPTSTELKQEAANPGKPKKSEPFAFADWSWMTGNARTKDVAADSNQIRCELHQQLQPSEGQHHWWFERDFPLRRGSAYSVGPGR